MDLQKKKHHCKVVLFLLWYHLYMSTLLGDIKPAAEMIRIAFNELNKDLDYSWESFKTIDTFFDEEIIKGKPKPGSVLEKNLGGAIFSIGAYIGETIIQRVPNSSWVTDDSDPEGEINIAIKFSNGSIMWPVQRVIKRIRNGNEDSIYGYG